MNADDLNIEQPIKILVVDDREDNLFSIETILEDSKYKIVKANSGKAALKILLTQHDFTLILMDVQMPDMNGIETANLIYQREKLKHIPIIFITAHNQGEEHMFEGYKIGAVDFIYKPINPQLLRLKVGVFAEMYQKTHQLMLHERKLKQANTNLENEIEERRMSEEKVRLLNQQLVENNNNLKATIEELDRFAYVASHDLQEPLRKILVFSDKLLQAQQGESSEETIRYSEKIVQASGRMQKLINDLLIFSRPVDSFDSFVEIDLNELLSEVLSDMEVEIERSGAAVRVELLPRVWGVQSQMRQLFQNLIANGIKFRRSDATPLVSIYQAGGTPALLDAAAPAAMKIVVEDNGIGFDSKYADEIFVVFKRLHSYHDYEGTGVGLSICKKIVDRHGGRISAQSQPNEGAKFFVEFPAVNSGKLSDVRLNQYFLEE